MNTRTIRGLHLLFVGVLLVVAAASVLMLSHPVKTDAAPYDARLGVQWQVIEEGWTGVWVRRGDSSTFDGQWTMPGQSEIRGVIEMHVDNRNVRMARTDQYTNQQCEYQGQISRDWRTAQGWVSCNNGPRVNWNANIYKQGERFHGNTEVLNPPSLPGVRREGPIIPRYNQERGSWSYDLTGAWSCNDGGTYYLRQLGGNVWWYGEAANGQWSNIFHGALDGEWLEGFWLDVPKGRDRNNGGMRLHIDSRDEFHAEQKTGDDFGGARWRRVR
ncbi:MAG: hypothetical protein WBN92_05945 [Terriglobia bacterium]